MPVVSTGIDCENFSLKDLQVKNSACITVLYVGRLTSRKNVDKIIYAFEKLYKKYRLKLIIVGDGPERERLENISKCVKFTGTIIDTEKIYKQADIFVSPSEYGEGLQGTILEAMSCGLTVVATETQVNKQLLANGRGIDIRIGRFNSGRIEKAINADRKVIAKQCREYVVKNYNWENKISEILEVIK